MTQVGHTLTGIALGAASAPRDAPLGWVVLHLVCLAFLANVPDLPIHGWGHDAYHFSHSIFVNLALIGLLLIIVIATWDSFKTVVERRAIVAGTAAWLSHFLLDSFYAHGRGIAIFIGSLRPTLLHITYLIRTNMRRPLIGDPRLLAWLDSSEGVARDS